MEREEQKTVTGEYDNKTFFEEYAKMSRNFPTCYS